MALKEDNELPSQREFESQLQCRFKMPGIGYLSFSPTLMDELKINVSDLYDVAVSISPQGEIRIHPNSDGAGALECYGIDLMVRALVKIKSLSRQRKNNG